MRLYQSWRHSAYRHRLVSFLPKVAHPCLRRSGPAQGRERDANRFEMVVLVV